MLRIANSSLPLRRADCLFFPRMYIGIFHIICECFGWANGYLQRCFNCWRKNDSKQSELAIHFAQPSSKTCNHTNKTLPIVPQHISKFDWIYSSIFYVYALVVLFFFVHCGLCCLPASGRLTLYFSWGYVKCEPIYELFMIRFRHLYRLSMCTGWTFYYYVSVFGLYRHKQLLFQAINPYVVSWPSAK